ncbi:cytidylyltransferase [bacterium]|nr:cytidylyltransferase [bacterium]
MKKKLVAVVAVRKGSQRVKNKNLKPFAGKNLLSLKIETLKKLKQLDEIIINTDSDEAIKIAQDYNISFHKRESYYASSECTNSEFWSHIAKKTDAEYIMFTNCTSPLVKPETYMKIIDSFELSKSSHDSINTASQVKEFLYKDNLPLNFNPNTAPNSQELPDIIKLNFAVNIISKKLMHKKKSLIGNKPIFHLLDDVESVDINTKLEFEFAEYLFKKNSINK